VEISFSESFKRVFKKRIKSTETEAEFWACIGLFVIDPFDTKLKTHKLSGKLKDLWSFSVGYDLRIVFYFTKDNPKKAILVDIGTHDEVY
jgi:mRNA-degrading endonuclease YafQ of YafQ-DinJ toxin-antitoxin module